MPWLSTQPMPPAIWSPLRQLVALVVLVERQKGLQLFVGDQQVHHLQPLPVFLGELLDGPLLGLAVGPALLLGRAGGGGEQGAEREEEEGQDDQWAQSAHSFTF